MKKIRPLRTGEMVSIIAPSSPFDRAAFENALSIITGFGLVPKYDASMLSHNGYLAGSDLRRALEFINAMNDPETSAVLPARGGYGAMRIIHAVDSEAHLGFKLFAGFSDITVLHSYLVQRKKMVTLHSPNLISSAKMESESIHRFRNALLGENAQNNFFFSGLKRINGGRDSGVSFGGNLSLIAAMMGTPLEVDFTDKILFLEEVHEPLYRIDRMLTQLSMSRTWKKLKGIAFGEMGVSDEERERFDGLLSDFAAGAGKPAVKGFPVGHGVRNYTVPLGVLCTLDAGREIFNVDESPYSSDETS
ncbi:MAG: LD-carboxypeptidase [Deltaproteobacteria bacterium]|nr:LD-carboxypeptidase [Deltaproteobacteria bacterium]